MNRVIAPTFLLEEKLDYDVVNGDLQFKEDLFNTDGNQTAISGVPLRTIQVQFPFDFFDLTVPDWSLYNVLPGDILRISTLRGLIVEVPISVVQQKLVVSQNNQSLLTDFRTIPYTVDVLRNPYNPEMQGIAVPNTPTVFVQENNVGGVFDGSYKYIQTTTDVDFTQTNGAGIQVFVNKYLYVNDPVYSSNNGIFRIREVVNRYTIEIDRSAPFTNPPAPVWASGTVYVQNQVVNDSGNVYYCLVPNTAGSSFADDLASGYWALYLLNLVVLDYGYEVAMPPSIPTSKLAQGFLVPGSVQIFADRLLAKNSGGLVYPAENPLIEGVDYTVDYPGGRIFHLSPWDATDTTTITYTWRLQLYHRDVPRPYTWLPAHFYNINDTVITPDGKYWFATQPGMSSALFALDLYRWQPLPTPFTQNPVYSVRELAFWAPDVLIDEQRLYNNFGYLVAGGPTPSSEQYRAFLLGVMQLFILGPAIQRIESALNVMAGLPVIRNDGEVFESYDTGLVASGTDGMFTDGQMLRGGSFTTDGVFTDPDANFFSTDLLGPLTITRAANSENNGTYIIETVTSSTTVTLAPPPLSAEVDTGFIWRYQHIAISKQFSTESYVFSSSDIGGYIVVQSAKNACNIGTFQIAAIINPNTVLLESTQDFLDESDVTWQLTYTNAQTVTTNQQTYTFPYLTPMKEELLLTPNIGTLTFSAFDTLTTAFSVVDYLVDPSWFRNLTVPQQLVQLSGDIAGRLEISPTVIPNNVGSVDGAAVGDPGLNVGADDEGIVPPPRNSILTWIGGNIVYLENPIANNTDIGQYLHIGQVAPPLWQQYTVYALNTEIVYQGTEYYCTTAHTSNGSFDGRNWTLSIRPWAQGSFQILSVSEDGQRLTLDRFPTPELTANTTLPGSYQLPAPEVTLPPFVFRRTVGFVFMDRFLKYHSFRVEIDTPTGFTNPFIGQLTQLINQTKPSYTFAFVDPDFTFNDTTTASDTITLGIGLTPDDALSETDMDIVSGTELESLDAYSYITSTTTGTFSAGLNEFTVTPTIPGWVTGGHRLYYCFGRFTEGHNADGTLVCQENIDYTFDYTSGLVKVYNGYSGDPYTFAWIVVVVRNISSPSEANGEVALVVGGEDPTVIRNSSLNPATDTGIVDRALTLTVT
jgi:hypothetical protein